MNFNPLFLLLTFAFIISGCSNQTDDITTPPATNTAVDDSSNINTTNDTDNDGFIDSEDNWPNDPNKPIVSALWGKEGETWDTEPGKAGIQSRLPFYGLAGYRDGADLPAQSCTLNVTNFGAIADDNEDDTDAFWGALNTARQTASTQNPQVICIPAGAYELSRQLHLNQSGIVLRGAGSNSTTLNYIQGMIAQTYPEFIGKVDSNWDSNKSIVLGDAGFNWVDALYLNELNDLNKLPQQGDLEIALPRALTTEEILQLQQSGNRIRLMQSSHYSQREIEIKDPVFTAGIFGGSAVKERVAQQLDSGRFIHNYNEFTPGKYLDETYTDAKYANGTETIYQQFIVSYQAGSLTMTLDRPVRFDMTFEHLGKRPKLQLVDTTTAADIDIGVESLALRFAPTAWGNTCTNEIAGYPCVNPGHSGYWAQGGFDILSDFSWIKDIRIINSDNPISIRGDFNTANAIVIEANRPTTETSISTESPQDPDQYIRMASTGHVGIGVHGIDNLVDNVTIKTNFIHSLSMSNSQGNVYSNVRAEQPENNPTDKNGRPTVKINLDHHRQIIHSTLWTNIQLGGSYRMWDSTGSITEGFNVAANNTYWGIDSESPEIDYWPHNRKGKIQWGYHYINIVGTNIQAKPPVPQINSIDEQPYPYAHRYDELNPFPYHPDHAHHEAIQPETLWPQNLYHAQRKAYLECKLGVKPMSCP